MATARRGGRQQDLATPIWERPEPPSRPAPAALSRAAIVRTAIEIADAGGLAGVSLRRVAAALDAGPMRLYGYLSTKDELLDLMADEVYGEIELPADPPSPRAALHDLAHATRRAALRHEWFVDLLGGRPHTGPHALAYLEAMLAAARRIPAYGHIDQVLQATGTLQAYLLGAVRAEITELRSERTSGLTKTEWQTSTGPYMERMLATGRFPTLTEAVADATHPAPAVGFEIGLNQVLDGIGAPSAPT